MGRYTDKKGIIEEKEENRLLREERELEKLIEETVEEFDPLKEKPEAIR